MIACSRRSRRDILILVVGLRTPSPQDTANHADYYHKTNHSTHNTTNQSDIDGSSRRSTVSD
jgi:hypothetical protein